MTALLKQAYALMGEIQPMTDEEFTAVVDWLKATQDTLPYLVKEGLYKLVNAEGRERL